MAGNKHQGGLVMLRQEKKEEGHKSPEEMKKVVMNGAKLLCPFHPAPGTLLVTSNQTGLQGNIWATEADNQKLNFLFLGICTHPSVASASPPCLSIITPIKWTDVGTILVQGNKTLLKKSKIKCAISGQDITVIHDGQTVVPNAMMNLSQDVVSNGSSRRICPEHVQKELGRIVHEICDGPYKGKCKGTDSCSELMKKINQKQECVRARKEAGIRCWNPPFDRNHSIQINNEIRGITNCIDKYKQNCKDREPVKEPIPEPILIPAPEENKGFLKQMEELTGLAGAALIIYLIISEGSRLFPPRNLVPVP
jgi:hypothetical protein